MRFSDATAWLANFLSSLPVPSASPAGRAAAPTAAHPFRIAVVGAGVAGSRAAHRLAALAGPDFPVRVTVFEAADRPGGRVRSVPPPGPAAPPLEAGAAYFFADDWCLAAAAADAGVALSNGTASAVSAVWAPDWARFRTDDVCHRPPAPPAEALWDRLRRVAERVPFTAGLGVTYGFAPWILASTAAAETAKWRTFGADAPFASLAAEFARVGLANATQTPANRFLAAQGVLGNFADELVGPCSRAWAGRDLGSLSGLAALLPSFWGSRGGPVAVAGGNGRLIDRLLAASGAEVRLGTRVARIAAGARGGYRLLLAASGSDEPEVADFDAVLLAAPLHGQDALLDGRAAPRGGADYAAAHVTHFASRLPVPPHVAARLQRLADVRPARGENREHLRPPPEEHAPLPDRGFVGLSSADTGAGEAVHRVVSRDPLADDDVLALLGLAAGEDNMGFVDWIERAAWPAGYAGLGRADEGEGVSAGEVEIAKGLYYLSGGEAAVGTMEMACRMGWNAAGLVARRWTPSAGETAKDEL